MEGNGIKRGLTAVEAAVVMKVPLDKVLAMILFSVIKKGAASVAAQNPLRLSLSAPRPSDLRDYENDFLNAFKSGNGQANQDLLRIKMVKLIVSVDHKMMGFSRKETIAYYKTIIEKELDVHGVNRYCNAFPRAIALLASGAIDVHPLVSQRYPLDRVTEAFSFAADHPAETIKVMVQGSR